VVKVFEFFSTHSHIGLVQVCIGEFYKNQIFFHFILTAPQSGVFSQLCLKFASVLWTISIFDFKIQSFIVIDGVTLGSIFLPFGAINGCSVATWNGMV